MDCPLLKEIEAHAKLCDGQTQRYFLLLLEALAQTSSGMYGGGYSYMESALQDAKEHLDARPEVGIRP